MYLTKPFRCSQFNTLLHFNKPLINKTISHSTHSINNTNPPVNSNHRDEDDSSTKLSALFSNNIDRRLRIVYTQLSPSMIEFSNYLYDQGYFDTDSSLFPNKMFDPACLRYVYGHNFLRHAAEKFGCKNQQIAKWLSGSELKKIALFGCPSLSKKAVFSAKTLRTFFKIQENTVCGKCVLKQSCKYANQNVWNSNTKNLYLPAVMNVISHYALESVHPKLIVPDEIKIVVARLLKVVVKLSQTVS